MKITILQRGSVAPYDTNVYRQVIYAPGAEYLLLQLQAISGTDRLAIHLAPGGGWVARIVPR